MEGVGLDNAGIIHGPDGVRVDSRLRTTNKRAYALGDVLGRRYFTHDAAYEAGIVVRNALFRLPARADHRALPRVTYTDPELAHVGMTEAEAARSGRPYRTVDWPFAENDRARCERRTAGRVKVLLGPRGRVLGASIVGAHAGELIHPWSLAVAGAVKPSALAQAVAPYPTLSEASKRAAGRVYEPRLFGASMRRLVRVLSLFG